MKTSLEWNKEEEGLIICSEAEVFCLTMKCFITGEEEAELQIQDVVSGGQSIKNKKMHKKLILKMIKCIMECFRLLWEEGFEETVLVEKKGSELSKILDSTDVVKKCYSEYMMRQQFEPQKMENTILETGCVREGSVPPMLILTKEEVGFSCENREKSFFCRLLPYEAAEDERSFYLYEVKVEKRKRNKGIATACLTCLFRQLAEEQKLTVYLQVGSYNEPALHVYRKLGFEISEEFCYYIPRE